MSTKHSSKPTVVQTYLCAVIFALLVSLVSQTNKLASVYRLPFLVLFFRYLFSFSGNFLMQRLGVLHCSYRGKGQRLLLLVNAIVYTSAHALQIWGLLFAPSILFAILFATVPVWVQILAFFILKERPGLPATLLVLVSLAALVIMILLGQNEKMGAISPLGFALLLMSCILEAGNNTLVRFLRKEYSPVEISFSASGIAFTLCLV